MAVCSIDGDSDFYGLGIRVGFYLQWYSNVLANKLAPSELEGLRLSNGLFIAANFLALLIVTATNVSSLHTVELYVILLLTFGYYSVLVPIMVWRLVTRCNADYDPWMWRVVPQGVVFNVLYYLLLTGVASYQVWFWTARVPDALDGELCQEYGFLFTKIRLNNQGFRILNVLFYAIMLLGCVLLLLSFLQRRSKQEESSEIPESDSSVSNRIKFLFNLQVALNLVITSVNVVAVELTIYWNHIGNVNTLSSAGQTIPFVIGIGSLVRILYVCLVKEREEQPKYPTAPSPWNDVVAAQVPGLAMESTPVRAYRIPGGLEDLEAEIEAREEISWPEAERPPGAEVDVSGRVSATRADTERTIRPSR